MASKILLSRDLFIVDDDTMMREAPSCFPPAYCGSSSHPHHGEYSHARDAAGLVRIVLSGAKGRESSTPEGRLEICQYNSLRLTRTRTRGIDHARYAAAQPPRLCGSPKHCPHLPPRTDPSSGAISLRRWGSRQVVVPPWASPERPPVGYRALSWRLRALRSPAGQCLFPRY